MSADHRCGVVLHVCHDYGLGTSRLTVRDLHEHGLDRNFRPEPPRYYRCGCCDCYHAIWWDGDCREDAARLLPEQLDQRHGVDGWEEVLLT